MDIFPQLVVNSLITASIYAILAIGFNLIYSTAKFFDLGFGATTAVAGFATFFFIDRLGLPLIISAFGGIVAAGLLSFFSYKLVYQPLRERKATSTVMLVASLGIFTAVQAAIAILFTSQFRSLARNFDSADSFKVLGGVFSFTQLILFICALLVTALLWILITKTKFGKALTAISDDEEVAKIVGINTSKILGYMFFIAGCFGGLCGVLVGFDTGIEPNMGFVILLGAIVATIIGGAGNVFSAAAGALLLGFIENFGIWKFSGEWKFAISMVVLILFLLFRPKGIFKR
ncbi:MAG: branched-chain amino acid ABC transporter permease [Patescibacteria group bacterium]